MQRLGGRSFIECMACRNLIWIRRSDMQQMLEPSPADAPVATAPLVPDTSP